MLILLLKLSTLHPDIFIDDFLNIDNTYSFQMVSQVYPVEFQLNEATFFGIKHTDKCIRRFGGIYAYCRYFIDRKW